MATLVRSPGLVAFARGDRYVFLIPGQDDVVGLDGVDVDAMAEVLRLASQPIEDVALAEHIAPEAMAMLLELGVLTVLDAAPEPAAPRTRRCQHVVVGVSAAVAAAGAIDYLVALADGFAERVDVVLSPRAQHFLSPDVVRYYGFRTWTDPYAPAHGVAVPHSYLADSAEVVVVAPASASMLHRLASGACSDLISLVVAATAAPVVVAPSMNERMWQHPPIQRNVAQLRADGVWVIDPAVGRRISTRDRGGVGPIGVSPVGLLQALDVVLSNEKHPSPAP